MFHVIIECWTRKNISIKKQGTRYFIVCYYVNDWKVGIIQKYDVLTLMFSNIKKLNFFYY